MINLVEEFVVYLREQKARLDEHPEFGKRERSGTQYVLDKAQASIEYTNSAERTFSKSVDELDW